MGATIKDVARAARVSPATVSRVINDSARVSEDTAIRVRDAIERLDYEINDPARTLRTKTSRLIGVIGARLKNPFLMQLLQSAEKAARKENFNLLLGDTGDSLDKKIDYLQIMKQKNIDGIIVIGSNLEDDFLDRLQESEIPAVIASGQMEGSSLPGVSIDNEQAGAEVMEYLLELGHRDIGIISGPQFDMMSSSKRLSGALKALSAGGFDLSRENIHSGDYSFASGFRGAQYLLGENSSITALFAFDDRMAVGAMRGVRALGRNVPGDCAVVGFDNIEISRYIHPALTTVHQPCNELGRTAMELLLKIIKGDIDPKGKNRILEHELIIRDSTAEL